MSPPITGVDHLLVGVRDLEAARETYARLGFTLTPRGSHIGWGTANYCIMFADGYVELLGIVDPAKFTNRLDAFLARREGLLGLAFATADSDAAYAALARAGVEPEAPKDLARNLELPEGVVRPRFRLVHLPAAATPALPAFLCQHLTPDLVRRPAWLEHPNGALGLVAVTVVVDDPPALTAAYARLLGAGAVTPTDDMLSLRVGSTMLVFVRAGDFGLIYSEVVLDPALAPPFIAGMTVSVADLDAAAGVLEDNGVVHAGDARGAVVVPPAETCGVALEFRR
ncbi:MAG: VOC family protein [Alphaproteobacteria bacterium]